MAIEQTRQQQEKLAAMQAKFQNELKELLERNRYEVDTLRPDIDDAKKNVIEVLKELQGKKFQSEQEAQEALGEINSKINSEFDKFIERVRIKIHLMSSNFSQEMKGHEEEIKDETRKFAEILSEVGLNQLAFNIPVVDKLDIDGIQMNSMMGIFETCIETEKVTKNKSGFWAGIARFFGLGGFSVEEIKKTLQKIDYKKMEKQLEAEFDNFLKPAKEKSADISRQVQDIFVHIERVLNDSLNDKKKKKDELVELNRELERLEKQCRLCDASVISELSYAIHEKLNGRKNNFS